MELAARECGWWMLRIFLWMQYMHMYIVWYLLWNHTYNCLFKCVYFFIYIIYLKKCVQKHNMVYIDKPTRNVITFTFLCEKKSAFLKSLKIFCGWFSCILFNVIKIFYNHWCSDCGIKRRGLWVALLTQVTVSLGIILTPWDSLPAESIFSWTLNAAIPGFSWY